MTKTEDRKLYPYHTVKVAEKVKQTAWKCGFDVTRIGSGVIMTEAEAEWLTDNTFAPEPVLVAMRDGSTDRKE